MIVAMQQSFSIRNKVNAEKVRSAGKKPLIILGWLKKSY